MSISLLGDLDNEDNRGIPEWRAILNEVNRTDSSVPVRPSSRQDYVDAHATTIRRIGGADQHYHILSQIYVPDVTMSGSLTTIWAQIQAETVIFMLFSSLDSLMQEVNLAYNFRIPDYSINVYHDAIKHGQRPSGSCVRCAINRTNDSLTAFLNIELGSTWFENLRILRNRISHKQLLATNTNLGQTTVYIEIPTDPNATRFNQPARTGIEINSYCQNSHMNVVRLLAQTYRFLLPKIATIQ
jgi:hypothetical protein